MMEREWFDHFPYQNDKRESSEFDHLSCFFKLREKTGRLLDAGCGYGDFTQQLSNSSLNVIGVDVSHKMLQVNPCDTIQAAAQHLPFIAGSFDYVFCSGFLHHFRNLREVLPELARALNPKGHLLIYEPSGSNLFEKLANRIGHAFFSDAWLMKNGATPNEYLHSARAYSRVLKQSGFKIQKKTTVYVKGRIFLPFGLTNLINMAHAIFPSRITDTHILMEASL